MSKDMGKSREIVRNLSNKYRKGLLDTNTKTGLDTLKTVS